MFVLSILVVSSGKSQTLTKKISSKIIQADLREVTLIEHAKLEITGQGDDRIHVLTVWGNAYEMGKAQGMLLKNEIEHLQNQVELMLHAGGQSVTLLDALYKQAKPHIPEYFIEEMKRMADGSGLSLQNIIRINLLGEAAEFHCSLLGAWGKATRRWSPVSITHS